MRSPWGRAPTLRSPEKRMFVSDAHLFVPREIRWTPIMALRYTASRKRKSLMRRLKRDIRMVLPALALACTFAVTLATTELAIIVVPTGAEQSPGVVQVQETMARLLAPAEPEAAPAHAERRSNEDERERGPVAADVPRHARASVAMLH